VLFRSIRPPVLIHVGSREFRNRTETALKILDAVRRGDSEMLSRLRVQDSETLLHNANRITFIDAARSDRVVLNFAAEPAKDSRQDSQTRTAPGKKH